MLQLILIGVTCGLLVTWLRSQHSKTGVEPPRLRGWLPVIGHGHQLLGNISSIWRIIQRSSDESLKLNQPLTLALGPWKKIYVLTDPDDCWKIANTVLAKDFVYDMIKPLVGDGLLTGELSIWKRHRKLLRPVFHQAELNDFLGVFNQQASKMADALATEAGSGPVDIRHCLGQSSLETVCLTVLGIDFKDITLNNNMYLESYKQFLDILAKRMQNVLLHHDWCYRLTSSKRKQDECIKIMHDTTEKVIRSKREERIKSSENFPDKRPGKVRPFLDILLGQVRGEFTDEQVKDHLNTFIIGGHETTAITLLYLLVVLGTYPHVQQKLHTELGEIFGDSCRDVEKTDLKQMVYMEAVIKESMRLYTIGPAIIRHLERDVKIKQYTLRAGNDCMLSLYGLNRHALWGADARQFRPERFLDAAAAPRHPAAFASFSIGKRNCIGRGFAMLYLKTALAHVLRRVSLAADHTQLEHKMDVTLKPVAGHYVSIEKRI